MTKEETNEALSELDFEQYKIESMEDPFNKALSSLGDAEKRIDRKQQAAVSPFAPPSDILTKCSSSLGINRPRAMQEFAGG